MTYIRNRDVPHWSVFCSGAWLCLTRWRKPCCSPRAHTRTVSRQCASADESSGSPDASTLYYSLRTDAHEHKHLYSVVFKRVQTEAIEQRCNSQCTCEVSRRCVCACGPPACTAPWRASALESSPSSDTRTPSSPRGCVRYWCAANTQTQQFTFILRVSLSPPFVMSALCLRSNWPCRAQKTRHNWRHLAARPHLSRAWENKAIWASEENICLFANWRAKLSITSVCVLYVCQTGIRKCDGVWLWESVFLKVSLVMDKNPQIWVDHKFAITNKLSACSNGF